MNSAKVISHITSWLKDYHKSSKMKGFVVGVSGGIDSAVTSSLCAKTGIQTLCVEMPIHQDPTQVNRAKKHIDFLQKKHTNVERLEVNLTETFEIFKNAVPKTENSNLLDLSLANTRARLRMTTLYYFAGLYRYLVAGTGNKVEDFGVGFYTKYGDGGVDLSPIADLMKSEVYILAKKLDVISEIIHAPPTDGLFGDSRSDEEQLGASYDELEWAMQFSTQNMIQNLSSRQKKVLDIYQTLNKANQHKINPIPVCKIPHELKSL